MRKIVEVLRLRWQCGLAHRDIAASCRIGLGTVSEYLRRAAAAGVSWSLPEDLQDAELERRLFPPPPALRPEERALPDWRHVHAELRHKGVTLLLLWEDYHRAHPQGFGYSRYCDLYRQWARSAEPRMRLPHKAGDKLFVDYAGLSVPVVDPHTGEVHQAQIFVAVLGASNYTFAEATWTQSLRDWIASHVRAFDFFGGVPRILVPDNLKSGVTSPCFYEPDINRSYLEMARHYGVAVIPARVRKPRDKAKAENAVLQVERWLLAPLRNHTFHTLAQLNDAIAPLLEEHNHKTTKTLPASRRQLFDTIDRPALQALPLLPFELAQWLQVRAGIDYHVSVEGHLYSVPHQLRGEKLQARITANTVEIFRGSDRVASHLRSTRKFQHTTLDEHMPDGHRFLGDWSPQRFLSWARKTGPATEAIIARVLDARDHPEQTYRACLGILGLARKYGHDRLEAACRHAIDANAISYRALKNILDNRVDQLALEIVPQPEPIQHPNIRGADYYRPEPARHRLFDNTERTS